jgi:hypothetical protein
MSLFNGHNKRDGKVSEAELHAVDRPETTRLYHVVREYWPEFQA